MPLRSLFVDFNSFFASAELHFRPELRGCAVVVAPVRAETTCAIAASTEAKKFGVKTGTPIYRARQMCPGLIVVEARPPLYVRLHEALVAAVDSCAHVESVWSIDEMECDLTGRWRERAVAVALAGKIKRAIAEQVGAELRCSIGIAPNGLLAKLASDMQKPDGLVVLETHELPERLHALALQDFCGISDNMERRLHEHGIRTVAQLCAAPKEQLRAAWGGIEGERMWRALRGEAVVRPATTRRSLGHAHVLAPEQRNDADARAVLHRLLQKAAMRLRRMEHFTGGLAVAVRYVRGGRWEESRQFLESQDTLEFIHVLNALWENRPRHSGAPLQVGVTLFHLAPQRCVTPSLFGGAKRQKLNAVVDALNSALGKNTVYFGGAHTALESAPMRIAFNRIPDLETEGG